MTELTNKIKHLEFIQEIIKRMANNSFLLKGWSLTLTVAILGFFTKGEGSVDPKVMLIIPVLFWYLDSYYLSQERAYRKLFIKVKDYVGEDEDVNFDLNAAQHLNGMFSVIASMISKTILPFYLVQLLVLAHEVFC